MEDPHGLAENSLLAHMLGVSVSTVIFALLWHSGFDCV